MKRYVIAVLFLGTFANWALLLCTKFLSKSAVPIYRLALGAVLVGLYLAMCLIMKGSFFCTFLCRVVITALAGYLAFGRVKYELLAYILLSFALDGLISAAGLKNAWATVPFVALIFALCTVCFRKTSNSSKYVPVEIEFLGKQIKLTALRDTGNLLCDPITGTPVLVVGLRISQLLTGLSKSQLQQPVEVMRCPPISGLRLIPYKTITQANGFILGAQLSLVRVGNWRGKLVVAFAPEELGDGEEFEALAGGLIG